MGGRHAGAIPLYFVTIFNILSQFTKHRKTKSDVCIRWYMEKGVDRLLPLLLVLSSPPSSPSPCAAPSSVFRCFVRTPPKDNQAVGRCREVVGTSISTAAWTLEVSPAEQGSGSNGAALAGQTLQTPKVHKKCYLVPPYLSLSYYYCSHSICHLTMCSAYASHTIYKCTTRVTRIQ